MLHSDTWLDNRALLSQDMERGIGYGSMENKGEPGNGVCVVHP